MRLARAVTAFDGMSCADAYTGRHAFFGQLGLYDDAKRDSEASERRVISTGPEVVPPPRRTVLAAGTRFIMGHPNPDTFAGKVHRLGWVVHEATWLSQVRTLGQVCREEVGFTAWCGRAWIKNQADAGDSSDLIGQYHLHFASVEPIATGKIVTYGGRLNLVRRAHEGPAGTLVALVDEMPEPSIETVQIESGAYDPVTEARAPGSLSVRAVRARWQSLFEYGSHLAPEFGPTDIQLAVAASVVTMTPGMTVTMSDGAWKTADAALVDDVWLCRMVRHG